MTCSENSPYYNLMGAIIDLKREWKNPNDVVIETLERVLEQLGKREGKIK